jgi:hypothetical protein
MQYLYYGEMIISSVPIALTFRQAGDESFDAVRYGDPVELVSGSVEGDIAPGTCVFLCALNSTNAAKTALLLANTSGDDDVFFCVPLAAVTLAYPDLLYPGLAAVEYKHQQLFKALLLVR